MNLIDSLIKDFKEEDIESKIAFFGFMFFMVLYVLLKLRDDYWQNSSGMAFALSFLCWGFYLGFRSGKSKKLGVCSCRETPGNYEVKDK